MLRPGWCEGESHKAESERLFSYKYKHFASPGEHCLSVLFFPFTHLKAQFIDLGFPRSQLTFNRLPGRVVNFEALGATGQGGVGGGASVGFTLPIKAGLH